MRVLIVFAGNRSQMPFIEEQIKSIRANGIDVGCFEILGKGSIGYLKNLRELRKKIKRESYDLIHAHYGLVGLLAILQRLVPVVITFHGSDVNFKKNRILSLFASKLSTHNIFVDKKLLNKLNSPKTSSVIPCGVDLGIFKPIEQNKAKRELNLNEKVKYILFSSSFTNPVKNYPLAKEAIDKSSYDIELIELKNYKREEVNLLFNACELLLLTSFSEGSPQVVKEALATNTPVVSTKVGDVEHLLSNVISCHVTSFNSNELKTRIDEVVSSEHRSNGRNKMRNFDLDLIANRVIEVYEIIKETN